MKTKLWIFLLLILLCQFMASSVYAQGEQQVTMTLLPVNEKSDPPDTNKPSLLWIQANPSKDVFLQFDLSGLPSGLEESDFVRCTLRIAAKDIQYTSNNSKLVSITGQIANNDLTPVKPGKGEPTVKEIVALSTLNANDPKKNKAALNLKTDSDLRHEIFSKYSKTGDKKISLRLHTASYKASSLFYSSKEYGSDPSNIPRLVVEYKQKPQDLLASMSWRQHQQNPEHTGHQPWRPFRSPAKFCLKTIPLPQFKGHVADYPLIYRGNLYVVDTSDNENYLFSFEFTGKERWRCSIDKGTIQRSPAISSDGIVYIVIESQGANHIAAYDLKQSGKALYKYNLDTLDKLEGKSKLANYTDLTIGNDGSIFLALNKSDLNYIYGFTPDLQPILMAGPFPGDNNKNISTITVSHDGKKIFAQIPAVDEVPAGAVVIDVANPSEQQTIDIHKKLVNSTGTRMPFEYYHVPIAGPAGNVMIFSDFSKTEYKSNVWGYSPPNKFIWNSASDKTLVSQSVLASNEFVYYIQNGQLQRHKYNNIGKVETYGDALNTTSNLVIDGADNIYFWDNGRLHGYSPGGASMFNDGIAINAKESKCDNKSYGEIKERSEDDKGEATKGLEPSIRLMMGPDGTIWANNKDGHELFVFNPLYPFYVAYDVGNLTLEQKDIKSQTVYRSTGKLSVGNGKDKINVEKGMQLLFQAQKGVGFAKGFSVEKGASILVRTGF
ncbi:MAG: hypothetical protein ABFD75_07760 [Smithella sp.]